MDKPAAVYARVSSDQQKENHTIQSQTAALIKYAKTNGCAVPPAWQFQDEGYSGATLCGLDWKRCGTWLRQARLLPCSSTLRID